MKGQTMKRKIHPMVYCPRGEETLLVFITLCHKGRASDPEEGGCVFFHAVEQDSEGNLDVVCEYPDNQRSDNGKS